MNEEYKDIQDREDAPLTGQPTDLTKDEYIAYNTTVAKQFGMLKMQKPMIFFFALYLVIIVSSLVMYYMESGVWDWVMLLMLGITLLCAATVLTIVPLRLRKNAAKAYDAGNVDGYYGEWYIDAQAITKVSGRDSVSIPLTENTVYLEDTDFMAFFSPHSPKAIILPARCVTSEMAAAVREAVFAEHSRVQRRVIKRMLPKADEPIARREKKDTVPLYTVAVSYEQEEMKKLIKDMSLKKYIQSLPIIVLLGVIIGALMAILESSLPLFFVTAVGMVLGMLLLSIFSGHSRARRIGEAAAKARLTLVLDADGVGVKASQTLAVPDAFFIRWACLERAVERVDCVEFYGGTQMLRIPKRCIEDFEAFRRIVDTYYQKKQA